jgi:hypothetical protein
MCNYTSEDFDKKVADRMKLTPNVSYDSAYAMELCEMGQKNPKAYKQFMADKIGMNFSEDAVEQKQ